MRRGILFLAVFGAVLVSCNAIIKKEDIELPKLPLCPTELPEDVVCDCNPYEDTIGEYITCLNDLALDPDVTYVAPTCSDKLSAEAQLECESTCEDTASDAVGYLLCLREFIKAELETFGLEKITTKLHKPIIPYPKLPLCPPADPEAEGEDLVCECDPADATYLGHIECLELFYGDDTDLEEEYCSTKLSFEAYTECDTTCLLDEGTAEEYIQCLVDAIDEYKESYGLSILGKKEKVEKCDPCTDDDCECDPYKELCPTCPIEGGEEIIPIEGGEELPLIEGGEEEEGVEPQPAGAGRRMLF